MNARKSALIHASSARQPRPVIHHSHDKHLDNAMDRLITSASCLSFMKHVFHELSNVVADISSDLTESSSNY